MLTQCQSYCEVAQSAFSMRSEFKDLRCAVYINYDLSDRFNFSH